MILVSENQHGHPQPAAGISKRGVGALALPSASFTTFLFPQKEPKSLQRDRLKINLNDDCDRGSAPDPAGGAYIVPPDPSCIQGIRFAAEKKGQNGQGRREGDGGEEWRDRGRDGV